MGWQITIGVLRKVCVCVCARKKGLDDTDVMLWKLMRSHENRKPNLP